MGKEDRGQGTGDRGQAEEVRGQRSEVSADEDRGQGTEVRGQGTAGELRAVVREVMGEFIESRRKTDSLEKRVNELIAENQEAQRSATIRTELQKLGVAKIELAYRAVKDDVYRSEDGRILAQGGMELRDYLASFVNENPELLPARMSGGSGASGSARNVGSAGGSEGIDLASIRPGMSAEEMDRVRKEVARIASLTLKGGW
jgi:hypothetical protein